MAIDTPSGVQLRIRGKVQGVGFRPLSGSWRSSCDYTATCNDGDGVVVRLLEEPSQFIAALYQDCPPLAH